jgi:hypothetical protein
LQMLYPPHELRKRNQVFSSCIFLHDRKSLVKMSRFVYASTLRKKKGKKNVRIKKKEEDDLLCILKQSRNYI